MLFNNTTKLREYAELTTSVNYASIKPTLNHVEQVYIVPILGKEQYDAINVVDENSLTDIQKQLLEHCRAVIAPYFAYHYAPKAATKLSDAGLQRMETANAKSAFQYQENNFRDANLREAEQQTELLLNFLSTNRGDFSLWTDSDAFKKYNKLFIKTGSEFDECYPSHSPFRNYMAMRSQMYQVEQQSIRHALGNELFDDLKTKDANNSLSDKEKIVVEKLKYAIANFTIAFSVPKLAVRIDANGITVSGTQTASRDKESKEVNAELQQISLIIQDARSNGTAWLNNAVEYIKENASDFGNWNEEEDTTPVDGTQPITDYNTGLKGSFIL